MSSQTYIITSENVNPPAFIERDFDAMLRLLGDAHAAGYEVVTFRYVLDYFNWSAGSNAYIKIWLLCRLHDFRVHKINSAQPMQGERAILAIETGGNALTAHGKQLQPKEILDV